MSTNPFENIGEECYYKETRKEVIITEFKGDLIKTLNYQTSSSIGVIEKLRHEIENVYKTDKHKIELLTIKLFNKYFYNCSFEDERDITKLIGQ